eukprot:TRINITY_DN18449_c0_g1_i1.p1 TRINITY_DN18449_c0_g1~~TRINITY_DN18449_c0_g1_i1.p1  ORF type:complete len:388 (+),score=57.71 TRINITY_DN18449_c0_g1_i1:25-1164(+)
MKVKEEKKNENNKKSLPKKSGIKLVKHAGATKVSEKIANSEIKHPKPTKETSLEWTHKPKDILIIKKPGDKVISEQLMQVYKYLTKTKGMRIRIEPSAIADLPSLESFQQGTDYEVLSRSFDFVITLGGDGTVLHASSLFQSAVPPIISFNLGSLGFLTPFEFESFSQHLDAVIRGDFKVTLRQRLATAVFKRKVGTREYAKKDEFECINEIVIDRGPCSYLCTLECYCDELLITTIQADGLIISTTTGSTAYSLSAGGTMVHPTVGGICFTPVCPHSLSCRPLMFPESANLRIRVAPDARGPAYVTRDGGHQVKLEVTEYVEIQTSKWPVPCINKTDHIGDWFKSLCDCLHWNDRKKQSPLNLTNSTSALNLHGSVAL